MGKTASAIVRVGPAGWVYDDWKGIVYPPRMPKRTHPLTYLADFFDTIEINVSFYRTVPAKHCELWLKKVGGNPRFKFTAKLWQRFTHDRAAEPVEEEARMFREGMVPLVDAGKLGALLVQFPSSFKRAADNESWLERLLDRFADFPLALEVRHASWDRPDVYQTLAERGVAFCNIDQPQFHDSLKPMENVTAPLAYIRLHGRNHADWFREDAGRDDRYDYLYSADELKPWLERIERMRRQSDEIYAITNNHYRGQAVVNAFDIQNGLGKTEFVLPQHLVDMYPSLRRLLSRSAPAVPHQEELF